MVKLLLLLTCAAFVGCSDFILCERPDSVSRGVLTGKWEHSADKSYSVNVLSHTVQSEGIQGPGSFDGYLQIENFGQDVYFIYRPDTVFLHVHGFPTSWVREGE